MSRIIEGRQSGQTEQEVQTLLASKLVALINERERELARVSRVLHDGVSQVLSAVGLQLDVMRMDFREQAPGIVERTAEIQHMLEEAIAELRGLSYELNPSVVERAGLPFALDRLVGRFRESYRGTMRLFVDSAARVPENAAGTFYKLAEFALDNVVEHSQSNYAEVLVRQVRDKFVLEVRDNGRGFNVNETIENVQGGLGLLLMKYYASRDGMRLTIHSLAGKGTVVKASCPARSK
ncbi:MAG: histidine kinase [Bryobacteraceae bacterium]|jgi:two-component system NarL family sensor kinase